MKWIWLGIGCLFYFSLHTQEKWIQGGVGCFQPSSSLLKKVYGSSWFMARVGASVPIWRQLYAFTELDYMKKRGHSLGKREKTEILLLPLSFGARWIQPITPWLDLYPTLGGRYTWGWTYNHSTFVRKKISSGAFGVVGGVGAILYPYAFFVIDAKVSYNYCKFKAPRAVGGLQGEPLQVGGLSVLGEVGCQF